MGLQFRSLSDHAPPSFSPWQLASSNIVSEPQAAGVTQRKTCQVDSGDLLPKLHNGNEIEDGLAVTFVTRKLGNEFHTHTCGHDLERNDSEEYGFLHEGNLGHTILEWPRAYHHAPRRALFVKTPIPAVENHCLPEPDQFLGSSRA